MKYLAVACALTATVFVYALFAGLARHTSKAPGPGVDRSACIWAPGLAANQRVCPDKHVFVLPGWVDVGPATPMPGVPVR